MEPLSIISLISLVFSVIATGAEMAITEHQNQQNIQLQQDTLHQQQEYATQAAETANKTTVEQYNMLYSPAARRRQLEDANLSIGLMYGGGGSFGQGSTAAQAATPATSLPYMNPLLQPGQMGNVMNALKTITEAENTQKDTEKKDKEIQEIEATVAEKQANVKLIEEKANTEVLTQLNLKLDADIKDIEKQYQEDTLENRIKLVTESLNVMIAQEENLWADLAGKEIDNKWKDALYTAEKELKEAQKELFIAQKVVPTAQALLMEAQASLADAQKDLTNEQKEKVKKEAQELQYMLEDMEKIGWKATKSNDLVSQFVGVMARLYELITGEEAEGQFRGFGKKGNNQNHPFRKGGGGSGTW